MTSGRGVLVHSWCFCGGGGGGGGLLLFFCCFFFVAVVVLLDFGCLVNLKGETG